MSLLFQYLVNDFLDVIEYLGIGLYEQKLAKGLEVVDGGQSGLVEQVEFVVLQELNHVPVGQRVNGVTQEVD